MQNLDDAMLHVGLAREYHTRGRSEDKEMALREYREAFACEINRVKAYNAYLELYVDKGLGSVDMPFCDKALELGADESLVSLARDKLFEKSGEASCHETFDAWNRAIALGRGGAEVHVKRGRYYARCGKTDETLSDYAEALALGFPEAGLDGDFAEVYRQRENWPKAIEYCKRAIKTDNSFENQLKLARVYHQAGKYKMAVTYLKKIIKKEESIV